MIVVDIVNRQATIEPDESDWRALIQLVLREEGIHSAEISVAVVPDEEIHELNRRYLAHDEPTDVLSFVLDRTGDRLHGEIVISADTAIRSAPGFGWPAADELRLYLLHGVLHLVGYDDTTEDARIAMQGREQYYWGGPITR
jgi:probable rRNA maturation factor